MSETALAFPLEKGLCSSARQSTREQEHTWGVGGGDGSGLVDLRRHPVGRCPAGGETQAWEQPGRIQAGDKMNAFTEGPESFWKLLNILVGPQAGAVWLIK